MKPPPCKRTRRASTKDAVPLGQAMRSGAVVVRVAGKNVTPAQLDAAARKARADVQIGPVRAPAGSRLKAAPETKKRWRV